MIADEREKSRAVSMQMKLALVTHNPEKYIPLFFGEASTVQTINQPQTLTQDFDPDDTAGTWKFTEKVTPEDAQSVLAELMATTSVGKTVLNDGEWQ